jgi:hypothetical protein
LISQRIKPAAPVEPKRIDELIGQLDSEQFKVREQATRELLAIGERIEPALVKALAANPTLEARRRLKDLRKKQGRSSCKASGYAPIGPWRSWNGSAQQRRGRCWRRSPRGRLGQW